MLNCFTASDGNFKDRIKGWLLTQFMNKSKLIIFYKNWKLVKLQNGIMEMHPVAHNELLVELY